MLDRIRAAWPKREEWMPFLGSFGIALLGKLPLTAVNGAATILVAEKMKENEALLISGIAVYALFNILYLGYDYTILKRDRVGSSAKANVLYRGLTLLFPNSHELNVAVAEVVTFAMNVVGINPDLSAAASTVASILTGDLSFVVANRTSDMVVSGATQLPYAIFLKRRKPHE